MGQAGMLFRQVRFYINDELTECYVALEATGDCPIGVQGWHHKTFPPSKSVLDIVKEEVADAVMWPQEAPPD